MSTPFYGNSLQIGIDKRAEIKFFSISNLREIVLHESYGIRW